MSEVVDIDLIISKLLEGGCCFMNVEKKNGFISAMTTWKVNKNWGEKSYRFVIANDRVDKIESKYCDLLNKSINY